MLGRSPWAREAAGLAGAFLSAVGPLRGPLLWVDLWMWLPAGACQVLGALYASLLALDRHRPATWPSRQASLARPQEGLLRSAAALGLLALGRSRSAAVGLTPRAPAELWN